MRSSRRHVPGARARPPVPRAPRRRALVALLAAGCAGLAGGLHPVWAPAPGLGEDVPPAARAAPAPAGAVLPDPAAPVPDAAAVAAAVEAGLAGSGAGRRSVVVADALTGVPLLEQDADAALVPASNQKLLTLLSLLTHADPAERLRTVVVQGADPGTVVLVAGGDILLDPGDSEPGAVLGRAGVRTLARGTARALAARGAPAPGTVRWDAGLFPGPAVNGDWAADDIASGQIGPVAPMALRSRRGPPEGAEAAGRQRPDDAAAAVAAVFAAELRAGLAAEGIDAPAPRLAPGPAPEGAAELAAVESATLLEQAELMVRDSDNRLAEVLSRIAARAAGRPASIAGGRAATAEALAALGVDPAAIELSDASGMSLRNRVPARVLEHVVRAMVADTTGALAPGARTLPVAGGSGTLAGRFDDAPEHPGQGLVRAKTGTLNSVVSLTGHVTTEGGRLLSFAVVLNEVDDPAAARDAADRAVAGLTGL